MGSTGHGTAIMRLFDIPPCSVWLLNELRPYRLVIPAFPAGPKRVELSTWLLQICLNQNSTYAALTPNLLDEPHQGMSQWGCRTSVCVTTIGFLNR